MDYFGLKKTIPNTTAIPYYVNIIYRYILDTLYKVINL